jgi:hypothetical protein
MQMAILAAILLAAAGAFFGALSARLFWADDLHHALQLRSIWDKTEVAMRQTIDSQSKQIAILKRRLGE